MSTETINELHFRFCTQCGVDDRCDQDDRFSVEFGHGSRNQER